MSTDVSETTPVAKIAPTEQQASQPGVPKKIVNAQTVCNEKNEKGKLCNGHLKQLRTGGETAEIHLRGTDVLFKCQTCGTLYMGPPLGHVRDPQKQRRVVETELAALLQAAGGTLPAFKKSATGAWVPANEPESHAPAAKPAAATTKPTPTPKPAAAAKTAADASAAAPRPAAPRAAGTGKGIPPPPAHLAPPPDETPEQKRARLARIVAEAKMRAGKDVPPGIAAAAASAPPTPARTAPSAATTSGTDSSSSADAHRPAAEAQAATGQASAAPLSPAAATASPAAGAETEADLAPEASTELTPGAPRAAATPTAAATSGARPASSSTGKGIPPPPAHLAPPPGETHEEKLARLRRIVEEAKARAGK
ncbi:MAG TPA: hypothetical protein VGB73_18030 [Pyrinomonadaceae bacterium]|jgi:hypothetical protein